MPCHVMPRQRRRFNSTIKIQASDAAASGGGDQSSPITLATEAVMKLMRAVAEDKEDRLEAFMEVCPDVLLDRAIASKKEAG